MEGGEIPFPGPHMDYEMARARIDMDVGLNAFGLRKRCRSALPR